jgi:hypothetical protein
MSLTWHNHPNGGIYAEVPDGQYRVLRHEVKGYGPKYNGYEWWAPDSTHWNHAMSEKMAKWRCEENHRRKAT